MYGRSPDTTSDREIDRNTNPMETDRTDRCGQLLSQLGLLRLELRGLAAEIHARSSELSVFADEVEFLRRRLDSAGGEEGEFDRALARFGSHLHSTMDWFLPARDRYRALGAEMRELTAELDRLGCLDELSSDSENST